MATSIQTLHAILSFPRPQLYAPASQHSAPFRFMDLPAELRNHIYELSLTPDRSWGTPAFAKPVRPSASLTRVNSQVRAETLEMFKDLSVDCVVP